MFVAIIIVKVLTENCLSETYNSCMCTKQITIMQLHSCHGLIAATYVWLYTYVLSWLNLKADPLNNSHLRNSNHAKIDNYIIKPFGHPV